MEQRDEALEQYFESMKELVAFKPFQTYVADRSAEAEHINSVENIHDDTNPTDCVRFRKGQLSVIRTMENLQSIIEIQEDNYLKSLEADDDTDSLEL